MSFTLYTSNINLIKSPGYKVTQRCPNETGYDSQKVNSSQLKSYSYTGPKVCEVYDIVNYDYHSTCVSIVRAKSQFHR